MSEEPCHLKQWQGFEHRQIVHVDGEGNAPFEFLAFTRTMTGDEFVEVFGGKRGKEKMRYIRPDRLRALPVKRKRRAPGCP